MTTTNTNEKEQTMDTSDIAAEVLDELLAGQQVRERDWAGVEWAASIDAPGMLAAYSGAGHELAWLDEDGHLSVIDPDGNVLDTDTIVARPTVVGRSDA